jgi:hypothetical protein
MKKFCPNCKFNLIDGNNSGIDSSSDENPSTQKGIDLIKTEYKLDRKKNLYTSCNSDFFSITAMKLDPKGIHTTIYS